MNQITPEDAEAFVALAPRSRSKLVCTICNEYSRPTNEKRRLIMHIMKHLQDQQISNRDLAMAPIAVPSSPALEVDEEDFNEMNTSSRRLYECIHEGCGRRFNSTSELNRHERTHLAANRAWHLKSFLLDEEEGLFFVRTTTKGQDFKVHVNIKSGTCDNKDCLTSKEDGSTLICRHIRSARSGNYSNCDFFNLTDELIENSHFSMEKKFSLRSLQDEADSNLKPMLAEQSDEKTNARHFSVFVTISERAYVKLTSPGNVTAWKCSYCSKELNSNCVHIHAAMIIVGNDVQYESTPLNSTIQEDVLKKYAK